MAWQEQSIVEQRREFVALASQDGANIKELCARFKISRTTGYKWLKRVAEEGDDGVHDRSRRPHHSPNRTSPDVEAAVLEAHHAHPYWGARKLAVLVARAGFRPPSPSTILAILARHGCPRVPPEAAVRPWQRFVAEAPNDLWQMDAKGGLRLETGTVIPLAILDDHSRYALHVSANADQQRPTIQAHLTATFQRYGLPRRILSDNGPPWGAMGQGELTGLGAWLIRLGIRLSHGRAYHPQTQGKIERLFGTLQTECLAGPPLRDAVQCQRAFEQWRLVYNTKRPHQELGMDVPAEHYQASWRPFPEHLPAIEYGPDDAVRMVKANGVIRYANRQHFVGRGAAGLPVAVRPTREDGVLTVHLCHQQIRTLDLRVADE